MESLTDKVDIAKTILNEKYFARLEAANADGVKGNNWKNCGYDPGNGDWSFSRDYQDCLSP